MDKILYGITSTLIECIKILVLYWGVLNGNLVRDKRKYLYAAGGTAAAGAGIIALTGELDVVYSFILKITGCMLLTEDKLKGRATGCFVCLVIINIIDSFPSTAVMAAEWNYSADNNLHRFVIDTGMLAVYLLLGIIWHKSRKERRFAFWKIEWKSILLFILEFIVCIMTIGGIQMLLQYADIKEIGRVEKAVIGILSSAGCMIMLLDSIFKEIISVSRDEYKELLKNKEKYFEMNYHYYKEMHDFRHDMMKHLKCIYQFCASGKVEKGMNYIQEINKDIRSSDGVIDCGNETVSAVVNNIYDKLKDTDIDFLCIGHAPDVNVRDVDLCTVFSNVFENAYESCLKVKGKKMIHITFGVTFGVEAEHIYMYMENSTIETEIKSNQKLYTKKEGMHGIGMKNVCEVIERYGGWISWNAKNGIFVTEIFL